MAGSGAGLAVVGTASGVGKSTVVAGLCRLLARRGLRVAPFKAQNMSNHAAVTADGGEVGRAQAMQAAAARVDVTTAMNPILLKPSAAMRRPDGTVGPGSHVIVRGREVATTDARDWGDRTATLRAVVRESFDELRAGHDVVIAEGAGGAAEINLLDRDLVNLPFAADVGIPAVLVVDIERGGAFAAAHGTVDLLPPALRAPLAGIVFNSFRGDPSLLDPGIADLERRTGLPVLGVLPRLDGPLLGVEDSLDLDTVVSSVGPGGDDPLRVAAVRLPHLANPSDLDPLVAEPDVEVRWATRPGQLHDVDLIVVPGSRATVADLDWLGSRGLDGALRAAAARGTTIIGICAGQQLLGRRIVDDHESGRGRVDGIGLLDATTIFGPDKVVTRCRGRITGGLGAGAPVAGYQIHSGRCTGATPWLHLDGSGDDGAQDGTVFGTSVHGLFDDDVARAQLLAAVADRAGRPQPRTIEWGVALDRQHDALADWLAGSLDIHGIDALLGAEASVR